jgi:MFS family permease
MLPAMACLGLFSIGTATSKNAQSVFITRFFAGVFGSAPVSNVSAALGDIWSPKARGTAVTFYAVAVVGGPTLGPVIGAALLVNPHLGWRFTEYIEAIWVFTIVVLCTFAFPEVYGPVLLKRKAQRLRKETGNQALYHPQENIKISPKTIVTKHFSRPLLMLTTEPIVIAIALYASFVYAMLYLTLEVFPIVFQENRHYSPVVGSLPFLGLFIGVCAAVFVNLANQPRYARIADAAGGKPVPEARCAPMAVGGVVFAIGLFWFGWTADPRIPCGFPCPFIQVQSFIEAN